MSITPNIVRHSLSSFLAQKHRNDTRKLLSPCLHFAWNATYCSQGCTIARLPLSPQLQTIGKALLPNYGSNNSSAHPSRHRNWWKCSVEFPFRLLTSDGYVIAVYETFIAKCETVRLLRSGASEKKFPPFRNDPRQHPPRPRKREINLRDGRVVRAYRLADKDDWGWNKADNFWEYVVNKSVIDVSRL